MSEHEPINEATYRRVTSAADLLTRYAAVERDFHGAYLRGADLRGADLTGAYLGDANLRGVYLRGANLGGIRADVEAMLAKSPHEVSGLLAALHAGEIDGAFYEGACACLVGTIAKLRGCSYEEIPGLDPDSRRPAERWALAIRPGDTPENSQVSAITAEWVAEWLAAHPEATQQREEPTA